MTAFDIKLIAILTMVIDHIGLFFFPNVILFRVIGRLAFPLFAWLIANGAYHTKNINIYLKRLFIFALISQIPYLLANQQIDPNFSQLNIFFTLFLGLLAIKVIKQTKNKKLWVCIALTTSLFGELMSVSYGAFGVLSIIFFYIFFKDFKKMALAQSLLIFVYLFKAPPILLAYINLVSLGSLAFIYFYNKKEGPKAKYLFYIFYPAQYLVIWLLLRLLSF